MNMNRTWITRTAVTPTVVTLTVVKLFALCCAVSLLAACSSVKPWERGQLAKYEMAFEPDPLEAKIKGHVYFSKEAAPAGSATSGGGCGCN